MNKFLNVSSLNSFQIKKKKIHWKFNSKQTEIKKKMAPNLKRKIAQS